MRSPIRRAVLAAGAVALVAPLAFTGAGSAGAALTDDLVAAPAWTPGTDVVVSPGDVAARMVEEGIDAAEAERRFRVEHAAAGIQLEAERRWPDTFAGLWMDRETFGIRVAFTRDAAANVAALATGFPYAAELRPTDAAVSYRHLTQMKDRLTAARTALQVGNRPGGVPDALAATKGAFDLDIDVPKNTVVVGVESTSDGLTRDLVAAYGPQVRVSKGLAKPTACSIYDCRYAMLGGLNINTGYVCSSAFSAFSGSARYVLSAAHCYTTTNNGNLKSNGGAYYGYTEAYGYSGPVDAERIRRAGSWQESGKFFVEGENPRYVTYYMPYANFAINAYIGKTGRTTGTSRGYVVSKTVSPSYVSGSYNFISADFCVDGGDSGGAVWEGNTAYGIVSGVYPGTFCRPGAGHAQQGGRGIFGSIEYAQNTLGISLIANLNLAPSASFTYSCTLLLACSFNGSGSKDQDGSITSYSWNFGDGTTGSGTYPAHTYTLPGTYTVSLTVRDNNNATGYTSQSITVL